MPYRDKQRQARAQRESYERLKTRDRRREKKASIKRFLRAVKATAGCYDCGFDDERALDFDHRQNETKQFGLSSSQIGDRSWRSIVEEMLKCDVRCANCHRIETWRRGVEGAQHPVEVKVTGSIPVVAA